jgi:3-oxoacyl-[acyl-carrier-protein] synthase-1
VVLTDIGLVSALGSGSDATRAGLQAGVSALSRDATLLNEQECLVGQVKEDFSLPTEHNGTYSHRFYGLVRAGLRQLDIKVEKLKQSISSDRIGVVVGSSTSGIHAGEQAYVQKREQGRFPSSYHYRQQEMGSVAEYIRLHYRLTGPAYTISTACTSGAKALLAARRLIRAGICDAVITGGADSLCKLTVQGFNSLGLVSPEQANPLSINRAGLNLGEGVCLFTMERGTQGVELLGGGESSDAYHMSAPHPEGVGAVEAIRQCLAEAQVKMTDVGYVNLHGTGTRHNDRAEAIAVSKTVGDSVPCSSTKPFVGHLLGAAGAFEAGVAYLLLHAYRETGNSVLPPHLWDQNRDPELPSIRIVHQDDSLSVPNVLSTSFAFGGSNCAILLGLSDG